MLVHIFGYILIIGGILDSWKYIWHVGSIIKVGSSKSHSRKFINAGIFQDLVKIIYGILIQDWFITLSCFMALVTMIVYFYIIYKYYPYRYRGLKNWKRPNLIKYTWNSLLPNKYRKKL